MIRYFKVGGCVRDQLMGRKSKDIDFAVEAPSYDAMKKDLLDLGVKIFQERPEFFTVRGNHPKHGAVDFTLCRKDGFYSDARRPDSVEIGTIQDDLSRRDFTMNAIAVTAMGEKIIDPFGGQLDISSRLIRCVGDVNSRMKEDGLRGYRAMRFAVTLGFQLSHSLESFLLHAPASIIENVSLERIRDEIYKMFEANTFAAVDMIQQFRFPWFQRAFGNNDLWLKPTAEKR
jgi:tRNA nucleotidyltransferase (CCA-adding enzyme)